MCGVWHPGHSSTVPAKCLCLQTVNKARPALAQLHRGHPRQTKSPVQSVQSAWMQTPMQNMQTQAVFISGTHAHTNRLGHLLASPASMIISIEKNIAALMYLLHQSVKFSHGYFLSLLPFLLLFPRKNQNKKYFQTTFISGMMFYVTNDRARLHAQCSLALHKNSL